MEDISLNKIADMIINSVYSGLKAVNSYSLSKDQVKDEVILLRNRLGAEYIAQGLLDMSTMTQTINCLELTPKDIKDCCDEKPTSEDKVFHADIPRLMMTKGACPITFVGTADKKVWFKVTTSPDFIYRLKYDKFTRKKPLVWINNNDLWLFNAPKTLKATREISIIGAFENPNSVNSYKCCKFDDDSPFPSPPMLIDRIVGKLVEDYIRYYRFSVPMPNTGADFPNMTNPKKSNAQ